MRAGLALVAAGMAVSAAAAADFETPVTLPPGSQIDVSVARTRSGSRIPEPMTITFRYRQDIRPAGEGYLVRQRLTGIDYPPGLADAEKAQVAAATAPVADLSYDADESLTPLRINDWQQMVARLGASGTDERSRSAAASVQQLYGRMTPEQAARSLLREQQFPAAPQGTSLELRKPLSEATQMASPLGGGPIDGVYTIELESLDKAHNRAVIRIRSTLDSASVTRNVGAWLRAMGEAMPSAPKPTPEQIAAIRIDRSVDCRHEMDLVTGLALVSDCTQTVSGTDQGLKPLSQVDRWVITQAVVRPN